jgi:hypothetical protein
MTQMFAAVVVVGVAAVAVGISLLQQQRLL